MDPQKKTTSHFRHDNRIYRILVIQMYTRSNIGIIATIVNSVILVAILWDNILRWKLVAWFSIIILATFIRTVLNRKFLRRIDREENLRRWGQLLIAGLGATGILWGSTAIFLFPASSVSHQVFIAFVLAGMVAGAVGVLSPILPAFLVFSIPALLPITVRFIVIGDELHLAMGTMTTLFAILTFTTAKRIHHANKELIELKETFADQLEQRTAELENTNKQLRQEIEERKKAEHALADTQKRLNGIIEFLPDPTWVIDSDGRVIAWNRAMERLTGIHKKEILGKGNYAYAVPLHGEPRPMLIDFVLKRDEEWEKHYLSLKEENGVLISSESYHPSMGVNGCYIASTASRLYDLQGNVVGAIESIRDITAAKRSEQERERLIVELQNAAAKVRTLSGLLPICSSCKKIRDDKGYWNQIEAYIRDHSDAEFSHGLCPECTRKLYPYLGSKELNGMDTS